MKQTPQTNANVSKLLAKCYSLGMAISAPICAMAEEAEKQANPQPQGSSNSNLIMGVVAAGAAAGLIYKMTAKKEAEITQPTISDLPEKVKPRAVSAAKQEKENSDDDQPTVVEEENESDDEEEVMAEEQKKFNLRRDEFRKRLTERLNEMMPFEVETDTGILMQDAFMSLRGEITAHTFLVFEPRKQELMRQRLAAFKKNNWEIYQQKINQASQDFYGLSHAEMEFALNEIDLSVENYMASLQKMMKIPNIQEQCQANDMALRSRLDQKTLTNSREELLAIYLQLQKDEYEVEKMKINVQDDFTILVEKTKLYDKMYLDHGIKIHWFNEACVVHNLTKDPVMLEFFQFKHMEMKLKGEKIEQDNKLSAWFIESLTAEGETLPECEEIGKNTLLPKEYFFPLWEMLAFHINAESMICRQENKVERRKVLATGNLMKYQQCIATQNVVVNIRVQMANKFCFEHFKIPQKQFEASQKVYKEPQGADKEEIIGLLNQQTKNTAERFAKFKAPGSTPCPDRTKQETLKYFAYIEEKKLMANVRVQQTVRSGAFTEGQAQEMLALEKTKTFDELFLEYGIEDDHLEVLLKKHELTQEENGELHKAMKQVHEEFQVKLQQLQQASVEIEDDDEPTVDTVTDMD